SARGRIRPRATLREKFCVGSEPAVPGSLGKNLEHSGVAGEVSASSLGATFATRSTCLRPGFFFDFGACLWSGFFLFHTYRRSYRTFRTIGNIEPETPCFRPGDFELTLLVGSNDSFAHFATITVISFHQSHLETGGGLAVKMEG